MSPAPSTPRTRVALEQRQEAGALPAVDPATGGASSVVAAPPGLSPREARFVLRMFTRLKENRFGRLTFTVSGARLVDVELVERVDREFLRHLQPERTLD
jgi:hypothetical protein